MFLCLLLACRDATTAGTVGSCAVAGGAGDPVYLDCRIRAESGSSVTESLTDGEGRTVAWSSDAGAAWAYTWDGPCLVEERGGDGVSAYEATRVCDALGNAVLTVSRVEDAGGVSRTTTATDYTYDDEGRALVAVTTTKGDEGPPSVRTCTYSAWEGPDACATDREGDDDFPVQYRWTYDEHGNVLTYDVWCRNPGWSVAQAWERDADGRTSVYRWYDSALGDTREGTYVYAFGQLIRVDWWAMGNMTSSVTYTYDTR